VTTIAFDLDEHRARRVRELSREVEHLRAERDRLLVLLGDALAVAVGDTGVDPLTLLDVLGELRGTDLGRAACVESRERRLAEAQSDLVLRVLRETAA
jgi:hypothetical protein